MIRFKTDENIHPEVSVLLRRIGHDAVTVWDQGLRGASDERIIAACYEEGRVLVTIDMDFADARAVSSPKAAGIIVLRLARQDRRSVVHAIERVMPVLESEPVFQHLWVVDEYRVRIRSLEPPNKE